MPGKGSLFPPEDRWFDDDATGARIHQLTSRPCISHLTYFLQSSITPDLKTILFTSYRTGAAQLFEAALEDGAIRQLTGGAPIHPYSPALHPEGERVFFVRGGSVWALDRASLAETCILDLEGAQLGECTLGDNGRRVTAAVKQGSQCGLVTARSDGAGCTFIPFPRTVIHPQFHPLDPEWLEFAADPAPRMYRVRRDGTGLECLYEQSPEEWITHETFLGSTGDLVFVRWPKALYRMDWTTREISRLTDFKVWHISPNRAGTRVLCDTNHPDEGVFEIDVASGARRPVCRPQSSNGGTQWAKDRFATAEDFAAAWKDGAKGALSWLEVPADTVYGPQWTHPHPCYSPDEKLVTFTSDRTGHAQVYVAELPG
ncbi:MAG: PD40 domain-containing protein [Acidobacteria bacterium]|nr:PD40 domain-containing protein [Acidobacteriota bacterium]